MTKRSTVGAFALASAASLVAAGCHRSAPVVTTVESAPAPPMLPQSELSPPALPLALVRSPAADTASEAHVTIDTHGAEVDARQILAFLAEKGKLSLVYSPDVNQKVRLQLVDVPVSEALRSVLSLAGLTLEGTTSIAHVAPSASVVFYQLPVNIDSLSVESIMKRFGVGRGIAELLVQARPARP
jgi:hypothetical protein